MKTRLLKYLCLILIGLPSLSFGQCESAIELMADTASWQNWPPNVGGASLEEEEEGSLYIEAAIDLGLWTLKDSIAFIPAYEEYEGFDTRNLFHHDATMKDLFTSADTLNFLLCRDVCDFVYPAPGVLTSPFGPRWGRMHYGLDIDLETGDPVAAAFEGMVRISQFHASYGNVVVIRHSNGLETLYAHMSQRRVKPGDYVQPGDIIGLGGNTGRSYGSHLHFEIRFKGQAIDPNYVVDPGKQALRDWNFSLTASILNNRSNQEAYARALDARSGSKKYHVVHRGETLSSIARKRGTSVSALCRLNNIHNTNRLRAGQKLRYK